MLTITTQTPFEPPKKLGGMNKAKKVIKARSERENLEASFMRTAFVSNRAEGQKNDRKNKRK